MNTEEEDCPICLTNVANYYTECNHAYCIACLCRIGKCALCRKDLLRKQLCVAIKHKRPMFSPHQYIPLSFWVAQNPGLAIPVMWVQPSSNVQVDVDFEWLMNTMNMVD